MQFRFNLHHMFIVVRSELQFEDSNFGYSEETRYDRHISTFFIFKHARHRNSKLCVVCIYEVMYRCKKSYLRSTRKFSLITKRRITCHSE